MKPVVAKFIRQNEERPNPPLGAKVENPKTIDEGEDRQLQCFCDKTDQYAAEPHRDTGRRIPDLI